VSKRGEAPLPKLFPLSFEGEGDTGGKVDKLNDPTSFLPGE